MTNKNKDIDNLLSELGSLHKQKSEDKLIKKASSILDSISNKQLDGNDNKLHDITDLLDEYIQNIDEFEALSEDGQDELIDILEEIYEEVSEWQSDAYAINDSEDDLYDDDWDEGFDAF